MAQTKSNASQVRKFLSGLTDLDFHYLGIQIAMAKDARRLIETFNLSKLEFIKHVDIRLADYDRYLSGGYNYDIEKMARMQDAWVKLRTKQAELEAEKVLTDVAR
jgi:DNA-dependent RNA polymerase auxiliary subunit epsilon